jgi:hypothetical protein
MHRRELQEIFHLFGDEHGRNAELRKIAAAERERW